MRKTTGFIIISLIAVLGMLLLSIGLASANILIGGTAYSGSLKTPVSGVGLTVQCGSEFLDTVSLSDGTYAVVFDKESCSVVNVYPDESYGAMEVTVHVKDDTPDSDSGSNAGNKKTSGRVYNCGNGICDTGETSNTCLVDCPVDESRFEEINLDAHDRGNLEPIVLTEDAENQNPNSGNLITGAVISKGFFKENLWWIILIIFIFLVGLFFALRIVLRKPIEGY